MTQEEILVLLKTAPEKGMLNLTEQYTALVWKVVWGKLSGICREEDIEETVSDVFLDFYKKHNTVDLSKGSLATFLITLAQRRATDEFRRVMRLKNIEKAMNEKSEIISFQTENTVLKNEERDFLLSSVLSLGEPDSTIIFRKFYYGETYSEIGNRLGLSENAVNKRYLRAIDKLSDMMKGENFND